MDKQNIIVGLLGINTIASLVVLYQVSTSDNVSVIQPEERSGQNKAVATTTNNSDTPNNPINQDNISTTINPNDIQNNAVVTDDVPENATSIKFATMSHDFGTIMQDTENPTVFEFTNTGDQPLIIENAKGSCGCTVPNYPKEPIPPGGTGTIDVVYKPGKQEGEQSKTVTVTANTSPSKQTILNIRANVVKKG